ncbi:MAG TPA: DUF2911 domain-containing protein [Ohtaekwangia sp.]
MKYTLLFLLICNVSIAQIHLPELSPEAHAVEQVGYTRFMIRYGRPAARGRKIMGELVPYKTLWRTGAGRCSLIGFDQPVMINNKTIAAGTYALVTIPDENEWTILLNSDTAKIYGAPYEYDKKNEVIAFRVTPGKSDQFYESLTLSLDIIQYDAIFRLAWENTTISFPIKTLSYEKAKAEIASAIQANPGDPERLAQAAWFYYMNNDNPQQILAWLNEALKQGDDRWVLEQRFDVLIRMKDYNEATKTGNRAITFLKTTKPESWENEVKEYEEKMKQFPKK